MKPIALKEVMGFVVPGGILVLYIPENIYNTVCLHP